MPAADVAQHVVAPGVGLDVALAVAETHRTRGVVGPEAAIAPADGAVAVEEPARRARQLEPRGAAVAGRLDHACSRATSRYAAMSVPAESNARKAASTLRIVPRNRAGRP